MLSDLQDYRPEEIEIVLDESVKEKFGEVLEIFSGAKNFKDVVKIVNDKMNTTYPENEVFNRKLDDYEIRNIREEYCKIQEDELPEAIKAQLDAYDQAKRMKKDADDDLNSVRLRISDLAARVKNGTEEMRLKTNESFCIALNGYYLYFGWIDGKVKLAKAVKIPEWDKQTLWAQEDRNRAAMKDLFGIEFPEVEKPIETDSATATATDSDSEIVNKDEEEDF